MTRSSETRQEATREALLIAAEEAFETKPIGDVTLSDIAIAAGFTKGAVYSNFSSKTDLLIGVLERHMRLMNGTYDWLVDSAIDAEIKNVGELTKSNHGADLGYLRVMAALWTASLDDPDVGRRVLECQAKAWNGVRHTIDGMADAAGLKMPVDSEELTIGLLSMGTAVMLRSKFDPSIDPGTLMTTMFSVMVNGILSMAETPAPIETDLPESSST